MTPNEYTHLKKAQIIIKRLLVNDQKISANSLLVTDLRAILRPLSYVLGRIQ